MATKMAPTKSGTQTATGRGRRVRKSRGDRAFDTITIALLLLAIGAVIYPLYFILIASVSSPEQVYAGNVWLWPAGFTLDGYRRMLSDPTVWRGFANSLLYTLLGTAISVSMILGAGYALSRKDLPGRKTITFLLVITMFFDGGIIPRYLVVKELGMLNTVWAVVLPGAVAVWNLIIARSFFEVNIPGEIREAAAVDGASDFRFFFRIALPLAKPLIAVMIMIHLVWNWNAFFDALIYLNDSSKYPLQLVLRNILIQSDVSASGNLSGDLASYAETQRIAELVKYCMIVLSSLPLLLAMPFLQKHFTKGALLGAVKS